MEWTNEFLGWAWARHHNVLSWYVRPLFILPLAYFSYRRSPRGIALTLVALATSMFWFPAPERTDPRVEEFLVFEREWLTGKWTLTKVILTLAVPISLGAFCLAFWRRSLLWGLLVANAMALGKAAWSVAYGGDGGQAVLVPAVVGVLIFDAAVLLVARRLGRRGPGKGTRVRGA